jgi:hypothetical protein
MHSFKFSLGSNVRLVVSGESGHVRGRAEYVSGEDSYLVHYKAADGRAVEAWWPESALESAD